MVCNEAILYAGIADSTLTTPVLSHNLLQPEAGSFEYSGMHDHGPLVPPREGGDIAQLIGCVQAAQTFNNDFMTQILQVEKESANKDKHQDCINKER